MSEIMLETKIPFRFAVPQSLLRVLYRLQQGGHCVVVVGGALRDFLQGEPVSDYDLASDALPQQVQRLFRRCLPTGLQHGTLTIMQGQDSYQITTFRSDGIYKDGRHPEKVEFGGDLMGDLARRDFSINALAFEPDAQVLAQAATQVFAPPSVAEQPKLSGLPRLTGLVELEGCLHDPHGARAHLQQGLISAIGLPVQRFEEDALRMLRACRFSAKLGFAIEPQTLEAIRLLHRNLSKVSRPRVQEELRKLLCAPFALEGLRYLSQSLLWSEIFPADLLPAPIFPSSPPVQLLGDLWGQWQELAQFWAVQLANTDRAIDKDRGPQPQNPITQPNSWAVFLLQKAREQGLEYHPLLQWHWEVVPSLSFAWALLHLCLIQPEFPVLRSGPWEAGNNKSGEESKDRGLLPLLAEFRQTGKIGKGTRSSQRLEPLPVAIAAQGLDKLLFSNREKEAALRLLAQPPFVWGPGLLHTYDESSEDDTGTLLRSLLALWGVDFSLPALCLLAFSSEASRCVSWELWQQFCGDLLQEIAQKPALSIAELAINGNILVCDCGIAPGPPIGNILQQLLGHVLQHPSDNQSEVLQRIARNIYNDSLSSLTH